MKQPFYLGHNAINRIVDYQRFSRSARIQPRIQQKADIHIAPLGATRQTAKNDINGSALSDSILVGCFCDVWRTRMISTFEPRTL